MSKIRTTFEIMEELRGLHISTPRDAEFQRHLTGLLRQDGQGNPLPEAVKFAATGETRGIMDVDEPGGGKSTLVHHGLHHHPALNTADLTIKPFISAIVPSPGTYKSLGKTILAQTGYEPEGRRSSHTTQCARRQKFGSCGVGGGGLSGYFRSICRCVGCGR